MNKYFVVSDIHGFYDELIEALNTAGYDKNNLNHTLIVAGDIFDRGPKPKEVYEFLKGLPKERRILIKGNHEQLFIDLANKHMPEEHDYNNKTVQAYCQLAGLDSLDDFLSDAYNYYIIDDFDLETYWDQAKNIIKKSDVLKWLQSDEWVDYYELDKFIIVHSFIPLMETERIRENSFSVIITYDYNHNWRTDSTKDEWDASRWGCPWKHYLNGLFKEEEKKGKTLVCGHWHTSDFYKYLNKDFNDTSEIFYSSGIIAIDGGVYWKNGELYHPCNVLVIENGICYNKFREELKEVKIHD